MWDESHVGRTVGEFLLCELMGEGGYGHIYRAEQEALSREVVVKVLRWRGSGDDENTQRFLREARLASRLDHPYAAHIYSFGAEPDGLLWTAMEMVRGTGLQELLKVQGSIPLPRFVPFLEKLCEVVYTAHQQGIVHRDIKPSNVMILSRAGRLLPKLLDFGIARLADDSVMHEEAGEAGRSTTTGEETISGESGDSTSSQPITVSELIERERSYSGDSTLTRRGRSIGSPPYMAPEQWVAAGRSDARTDQYALGVLAYESLTGRRPFRGGNIGAMAIAHAQKAVPPLGAGFPPDLDMVIRRAMSKKPDRRFDNVLDLAKAFRGAAGLDVEPDPLPRLALSLRETLLARAPQPLADSVALLEAARSPGRALHAVQQIVQVAIRMLALLAVAATTRVGLHPDNVLGRDGLRRLRKNRFSRREWFDLAHILSEPFAARSEAHPVPEMVELLASSDDATAIRQLLERLAVYDGLESAVTHKDIPAPGLVLEQLLPQMTSLLSRVSFLCDYQWIIRKGARNEAWAGARRSARAHIAISGTLEEGDVVLATAEGDIVLALSPFCQRLTPAPGAHDEIFLFDGPGRFGARMVSFPMGFERHDNEFWSWYRKNLVELESGRVVLDGPAGARGLRVPYKGLATFSPGDADDFFGREREVQACVNRLRITSFLAVVGPSGAGKSSFVQAGLLPAMPSYWRAITVRPGPTPIAQLASALQRAGCPEAGDLDSQLQRDSGALGALLRGRVDESGHPLILVIDQFEELLTLCLDVDERERYTEALARAARTSDDPVRIIITLRDDFLVRAQQLQALRERLQHTLQILSAPPPAELERILIEPARRAGYGFEDSRLPREMVSAVADEPGALALLSFTAAKLWDARDQTRRQLTRPAYRELGGVGGALARHAEETLAMMEPEDQARSREVFRQLITADGTRAILSRDELSQILGGKELANPVLEALIGARLLVASEGGDGGDRVEVVHEALLGSWPRLVEWQREDAESVRLRDQMRAAARQWDERRRARGVLWHGDALREYLMWRSRYRGALTDVEEAFARASVKEDARGRRVRRTLAGTAFIALAAGLIVVLYLNHQGSLQRERAERFADEAATSEARAHERMVELYVEQGRHRLLDGDPMQALVYLIEARRSGADGPAIRFMVARAAQSLEGQELVLSDHEGLVMWAEFSPDGTRVATCGDDKTARIWDTATGELLHTLAGHEKTVWMLDVSPDGRRVATASWDKSFRVWDATTGEELWSGRHDQSVVWLGYTPDGDRLLTASWEHDVQVWNTHDGERIVSFSGGPERLISAALGPSGDRLITGNATGSVRVWDVTTGELIRTIEGNRGTVLDARISPDGSTIAYIVDSGVTQVVATGSGVIRTLPGRGTTTGRLAFSLDGERLITTGDDQVARVWDVTTGEHVADLQGHAGGITFAGYSPDGQSIVTTSRDGTVRTWDAESHAPVWTFLGHEDGIRRAGFDSAGDRIVSAGFDGTARIWNARQTPYELVLDDHAGSVLSAAPAPGGDRIATAQRDGTIQVWKSNGENLLSFQAGEGQGRVEWSPDGRRLLVSKGHQLPLRGGGEDASIWSAHTGECLSRFTGHGGETIWSASYGPDGTRIVSAGADGKAIIRDAGTGEPRVTLEGHESEVRSVAFDPTGTYVVSAGLDKTARLWRADTGDLLRTLQGHTLQVNSARFSVDGALVVTAGDEKTARVWNHAGAQTAVLEGHSHPALNGVFSADGHLVATSAEDGTVKLWDTGSGKLVWSIDHHLHPVWSVERMPHDAQLLTASAKRAAIWSIDRDNRDIAELQAFARCRVFYRLDGARLVRAPVPHDACRRSR